LIQCLRWWHKPDQQSAGRHLQYFSIDVPTNAFGWDLRLTNVTSGNPQW